MLSVSRRIVAAAIVSVCGMASVVWAEPVPDAKVTEAITAFQGKMREINSLPRNEQMAARTKAATDAIDALGVNNLTAAQIGMLNDARMLRFAGERSAQLNERLAQLAQSDTGADGARAAAMRTAFVTWEPAESQEEAMAAYGRKMIQVIEQAMAHPGFQAALKADQMADVFRGVANMPPAALKGTNLLERLAPMINAELPMNSTMAAMGVFEAAAEEESGTPANVREQIRAGVVAAIDARIAGLSADQAQMAERMQGTRSYLTGAYAMGKLVGHQAPELNFTWRSPGFTASTLADLRGKVVIIDFWATWCGPCVASFPQVRELAARYKDYPVVILGVTSLQGSHINMNEQDPAKRRIDTEGKPELEYELMGQYIGAMNMTWPVVFSSQEVFNPDYGVRGIPHVAIIDPSGVVRYRGLHPASPAPEKHEKIDGLLKEFNLPFPPPDAPAAPAAPASPR